MFSYSLNLHFLCYFFLIFLVYLFTYYDYYYYHHHILEIFLLNGNFIVCTLHKCQLNEIIEIQTLVRIYLGNTGNKVYLIHVHRPQVILLQ